MFQTTNQPMAYQFPNGAAGVTPGFQLLQGDQGLAP